jgi:ADP-ribose pyrophosphatase
MAARGMPCTYIKSIEEEKKSVNVNYKFTWQLSPLKCVKEIYVPFSLQQCLMPATDISLHDIVHEKEALAGKGIRILSTNKIYEGDISLRLDKFKLHNKVIERELVEHSPSIGLIPILEGTHVLLVTQYRHAAKEYTVEIPAGKIEKGETPKQAALREMREEIGYVGKLFPVLQWYLSPGYNTELMYVFVATNLRKVIDRRENLDDDEDITVTPMKLTTAIRKCIGGEIQDCKTVAALLAYAKMFEMKRIFQSAEQ